MRMELTPLCEDSELRRLKATAEDQLQQLAVIDQRIQRGTRCTVPVCERSA